MHLFFPWSQSKTMEVKQKEPLMWKPNICYNTHILVSFCFSCIIHQLLNIFQVDLILYGFDSIIPWLQAFKNSLLPACQFNICQLKQTNKWSVGYGWSFGSILCSWTKNKRLTRAALASYKVKRTCPICIPSNWNTYLLLHINKPSINLLQ